MRSTQEQETCTQTVKLALWEKIVRKDGNGNSNQEWPSELGECNKNVCTSVHDNRKHDRVVALLGTFSRRKTLFMVLDGRRT